MKRKTQKLYLEVGVQEGERFLLAAIHFKSNMEGKDCFLFSHRLHRGWIPELAVAVFPSVFTCKSIFTSSHQFQHLLESTFRC